MTVQFLEIDEDFVEQYGDFVRDQVTGKYFARIKEAADFIQKMQNKYQPSGMNVMISLDSFPNDRFGDWFALSIGNTGEKVCVWLNFNDEEIGKLAFDEFPCYDEKDSVRNAALREKWRNENDGGPSRIPV